MKTSEQNFEQLPTKPRFSSSLQTEEAVASAVAEFQSQGVDLSNIITTASGGDLSDHPLAKTMRDLQDAVGSRNHSEYQTTLEALRLAAMEAAASPPDEARQFGAIAHTLHALTFVLTTLTQATNDNNIDTKIAASDALRALLPLSSDIRTTFLREAGAGTIAAELVMLLLIPETTVAEIKENQRLTASLLQAVAASTVKDEKNKCAAMDAEIGSLTLRVLHHTSSSSSASCDDVNAVVLAVCAVLTSLTTADDESLPSSRAFPNARQLAKEGAAEKVVTSLRIYTTLSTNTSTNISSSNESNSTFTTTTNSTTNRDVVIALCSTLRQVAANDDICQEAAGAGAVPLALQLADKALETKDMGLLRAALNVLKQLASSDGVKAEIFEAGGLETIQKSLKLTTDQIDNGGGGDDNNTNNVLSTSSVAVVEQALGLLTNITLRNPEISAAAVASGCVVDVLRAMRALIDTVPTTKSSFSTRRESSLRQGCMALRNIAARCPEERQVLLAEGAEKLLREIKVALPESCHDVGSAALRDLGLNKYND